MTVLTYKQLARRCWGVTWISEAIGFTVVAATRVELAVGWSTPTAFDVTLWLTIVTVTATAAIAAGVYGWARCSDMLARRRSRRSVVVPIARHRRDRRAS